jgi:uncharacterized protein YcbX
MAEPLPAPITPSVVSLRRYPVKSMGGESLATVDFDPRGIAGDRAYAVRDADGRLASGKNTRRMVRRDGIFAFAARTEGGVVTVADGAGPLGVAGDPDLDAALTEELGADVTVAPETDVRHFDDGSVSIIGTATLDWCARELAADADPRRLRVNIVIQTSEPFEEEGWIGSTLALGTARLTPVERIERCRTIDLAQDGVAGPTRWLKQLGERRDLRLAVYCDVATPGVVSVGDAVTVLSA